MEIVGTVIAFFGLAFGPLLAAGCAVEALADRASTGVDWWKAMATLAWAGVAYGSYSFLLWSSATGYILG